MRSDRTMGLAFPNHVSRCVRIRVGCLDMFRYGEFGQSSTIAACVQAKTSSTLVRQPGTAGSASAVWPISNRTT